MAAGRNNGETTERRAITFYGRVQGVGFRWRACHAADAVGATGWVCNEWDGSVSMEIQGAAEQIDKVLAALNAGRYIEIDRMDVKSIPVEEGDRGFYER